MGGDFLSWLPFSDMFLHRYLGQLAERVSASTVNSHVAALGTFSEWAGFARPRPAMISYLIKGMGKSSAPPPKCRVHAFPLIEAIAHLDAAAAQAPGEWDLLGHMYLSLAMVALVWPVRPHALLSVPTANVQAEEGYILFRPVEHKREPTDWIFRVRLPAGWHEVFCGFLARQ